LAGEANPNVKGPWIGRECARCRGEDRALPPHDTGQRHRRRFADRLAANSDRARVRVANGVWPHRALGASEQRLAIHAHFTLVRSKW